MADFKSEFLSSLDARGFIAQCTDNAGLDAAASEWHDERGRGTKPRLVESIEEAVHICSYGIFVISCRLSK